MSGAVAFSFEDISVRFGATVVLDGLTAEIRDGVVTVVTGPSGAGKSTLLRVCNRLEVVSGGRVRFHGHDLSTLDPLALRRQVGMVFQRPALFGGSVRDNLAVARPDGDAGFAEVLGRVGLGEGFLDRHGDALSGGEAQRVCLARSLLTGPEILLMDEPTSSLDRRAARGLEVLARELVDGGVTVVWVSHDLDQVRRIADDCLVIEGGRRAAPADTARYLAEDGRWGLDGGREA